MKKLLPLLFVLLSVGCDKIEKAPPINYGTHYFYADNQLDRVVKLHFNVVSSNSEALSNDEQINRYHYVVLEPSTITLVRSFTGSGSNKPLNCLYYDKVLLPTMEPICTIHDGENVSKNIWEAKYWTYRLTLDKWTASYTTIITEDLF